MPTLDLPFKIALIAFVLLSSLLVFLIVTNGNVGN
jgi:hypothetical protein